MAADQWTWWRAALAGNPPPMHDGKVESGFYFTRAGKSGGRIPVAIWRTKDGAFKALIGRGETRRNVAEQEAADKWTWVCKHPVSREDYQVAVETGTWPDGTPTLAPAEAAPAGHNLPSDPFEALLAERDDTLAKAEAFLAGKGEIDKTRADMARNIQAQLLEINKRADAMHKAEKAPLLAATKAVDDKFRFRESVKAAADQLRSVFERWLRDEETRARAEAEKKFKAERAKAIAEQERIEAERKARFKANPIAEFTEPPPEMPAIPLEPEAVKVAAGGGVGRKAGLKTVYVPTITDWAACLKHYAGHPDVRAAVERLVAAETRIGKGATRIPGVEIAEDRRAA